MKRKTQKALKLTAEHAGHVLHLLIAEGKIAAKDVTSALNRREAMIHDLRQRLAALERGAVSTIEKAGRRVARKVERKVKRRMSPARRAALKLHGKYIGTVRTLSKEAKATVKAIRETSGVQAAIAAAKKMAT